MVPTVPRAEACSRLTVSSTAEISVGKGPRLPLELHCLGVGGGGHVHFPKGQSYKLTSADI